jgi:hypothetical protein
VPAGGVEPPSRAYESLVLTVELHRQKFLNLLNLLKYNPFLKTGQLIWCKLLFLIKGCAKIHAVDRGVEQWLARRAHNPEVVGSNPTPATKNENPPKRVFYLLLPIEERVDCSTLVVDSKPERCLDDNWEERPRRDREAGA